jgi:hypothetical protein
MIAFVDRYPEVLIFGYFAAAIFIPMAIAVIRAKHPIAREKWRAKWSRPNPVDVYGITHFTIAVMLWMGIVVFIYVDVIHWGERCYPNWDQWVGYAMGAAVLLYVPTQVYRVWRGDVQPAVFEDDEWIASMQRARDQRTLARLLDEERRHGTSPISAGVPKPPFHRERETASPPERPYVKCLIRVCASAISRISGVGAKPSSAGARTAWASQGAAGRLIVLGER